MATHHIFIYEEQKAEKQLGINTSYLYQDGFLRIYNKGRVAYFEEAKEGDAIVVMCDKGKVFLKKMIPPQRRGALVAWLLRFNKKNRVSNYEDYKRKLYVERKRRYWEGYEEKEYKSDTYVFTLCNSPFDTNYRNVVGFISDAITKRQVIELIPLMQHHPDWYIQKLLLERFDISEEEFEEARKNKIKPL